MKTTLDRTKLIALRQKRRLDQDEAAEKAGISKSTYISAEAGNPVFTGTAAAIANAFGVRVAAITDEKQQQTA